MTSIFCTRVYSVATWRAYICQQVLERLLHYLMSANKRSLVAVPLQGIRRTLKLCNLIVQMKNRGIRWITGITYL